MLLNELFWVYLDRNPWFPNDHAYENIVVIAVAKLTEPLYSYQSDSLYLNEEKARST